MRTYTNFDEIDKDLKILKLQTEIDKEEIKLSVDQVKSNLSPVSLLGGTVGAIIQKAIVLKAVSKIFGIKRTVSSGKR
ncbi:hypothetical protein C7S20_05905 [Christiangramia fulva]|uniref:Glutaminyl-tRNA synthetase n=1 Tax=Christiangramia fulva TaxID=2126553 RepID=A0A2R3Z3J3_9FLAO|nr:DUF6327 family protein [Christiangramia fulva]AVR44836.1 hypothetical protein C7S20_05905 [Christiangramia fulva]